MGPLSSRLRLCRRVETERHYSRVTVKPFRFKKIRGRAELAKEKTKKAVTAKPPAATAAPKTKAPKAPKATKATRATKATKTAAKPARTAKVQKVVKGAKKLAQNPMTTEVVAATLVAAAAALRDPKKAKALALEAADDLKKAAKSGADGGALWKLALDIARRSIDTVGKENGGKKAKKAVPKKKK
jgi:hypothetical protein